MSVPNIRIGHGYDVHRFAENRKLILGGTEVPYTMGLLGHSDADVLLHAIMDAIIGALGLGDIGRHFPDTDESYKNISSMVLADRVYDLLCEHGYSIVNIDATIIAQKPKLAPYISEMRNNIAMIFHITPDQVNVKATTEEKLGFTGRLEGISSHAVCLIEK